MRALILSDLHLEFMDWTPPASAADLVVLAGDIHVGEKGIKWARHHFRDLRILYVPGNHEFYGGHLQNRLSNLRTAARVAAVDFLDGDAVVIAGVRFLGATLWTDFALSGQSEDEVAREMAHAKYAMNDFRIVRYGQTGLFRPEHARAIHLDQVEWLQSMLSEEFAGSTVVITHHLPHRRSIHPKYASSELNPCFASDLDQLVRAPVALWVHGHTHESCDYVVNGTRVVCNPRGYLPFEANPSFDPALTIDLHAA